MAIPPKKGERVVVGLVTVELQSDGRFFGRWHDHESRNIRRILPVDNWRDCRDLCKDISKTVFLNGITVAREVVAPKVDPGPRVKAALDTALHATTRAGERQVFREHASINRFCKWLEANHAEAVLWRDLKPSMFLAYIKHLRELGLAFDSQRHALLPLRRCSKFMALEYDMKDIVAAARIRLDKPLPKPPKVLEPATAALVLAVLERHHPSVARLAAVCMLTGLRLLEAANLRGRDVDFIKGTVTVTKTKDHTPKNRGSWRTLPVTREVLDILRAVQPVDPDRYFLESRRGHEYDGSTLTSATRRALLRARRDVSGLPHGWSIMDVRKCFISWARRAGADVRDLQCYVGHARGGGDVLGLHYEEKNLDRLRAVAECAARVWRSSGGGVAEVWAKT